MKGLELSRQYFDELVLPAFKAGAADVLDKMTFGLVGPGSECLGFDDEISQDHDWGPRVCIWIPEDLFVHRGESLKQIYDSLNGAFCGFSAIRRLEGNPLRDGILSAKRFYFEHLGITKPPESISDWLEIPEESLSLCTGGEVFLSGPGDFLTMREVLSGYYPEDIRLKKISVRCRSAGRSGQYDIGRALMRKEFSAAAWYKAQFANDIAVLGHLLQRCYRPWPKWIFRSLAGFGSTGKILAESIGRLWDSDNPVALKKAINGCIAEIIKEMERQGLPTGDSEFLYDIGLNLEAAVVDRDLRKAR